MCGIAGLCRTTPGNAGLMRHRVERMTETLVHRGPDEAGYHVTERVGLGSRRLKVIDLETGRMPITNENGTVVVVYNGEIYNHRALRRELESRGHRFTTHTDTEVLVHLYEEFGIDGTVERLVGMFAFALWDEARHALFLARDRLGIKPLFYREESGEILFGSELKAVVADSEETPEIDPDSVVEYLSLGYIRAPNSIYAGYRKLPPAHILEFRDGRSEIRRYWQYPTSEDRSLSDPDQAVEALDELLITSVKQRLVADVPVGCFLSGGIDSSLVSAIAARHGSGSLETFSLGWEGSPELGYARLMAKHLGSEHHEIVVDSMSTDIAGSLLDFFDEPFGDSSSIPTYLVSQLARSRVTVALSGDGGDELFAGYGQHLHDARWAWVDRIPPPLRKLLFGVPARMLPSGAYGRNLLRSLAGSRAERFSRYVTQELDPDWGGILNPDLLDGLSTVEMFEDAFREARALPPAARLLYADATSYLPDDILTKVDRMSMAHSLEARVPLLDHRVVEFAARLPMEWKIRDGEQKWLLKKIAERYLPEEVIRRPKHGFSIPVGAWLRGELRWMVDMLESRKALSREFLHRPEIQRIITEHRSGKRDHSHVLWRLIMLEQWLRSGCVTAEKIDGRPPHRVPS